MLVFNAISTIHMAYEIRFSTALSISSVCFSDFKKVESDGVAGITNAGMVEFSNVVRLQ